MIPSFLTVGLWAVCVVCANRAARLLGGAAANFARLSLATVLLAIWAHLFGSGLQGPALWFFIASGVVGFGIGDIAGFETMTRLGPRLTALLVTCLSAPVAALIEWLWLGTVLTGLQMVCAAVILTGVALALAPSEQPHLTRRQWSVGALLGLLGALGQGTGAVLSRKGFQVVADAAQTLDAGTATYQRALGGLALVALFQLGTRQHRPHPNVAGRWRTAAPWIAAHVLTGPTLGVTCFQWALATTPSGIVMPIVALTPLAVVPLAWWLDGDRPGARSLLGGLVAVAGAAGLAAVR